MLRNYIRFTLGLIIQFLIIQNCQAQGPLARQWDYRYGGIIEEKLDAIIRTSDGGFLLGGYTNSDTSGDISQFTNGSYDIWIVKLNSAGIKQWDKRYGGPDADVLTCEIQTPDGGYLLGGVSSSGIGGDKTEPCWGFSDYWVIKIDSVGTKQWDKRFGYIYDDALNSVCLLNDGGYLLGGYSDSPAGGDKSDSAWNGSLDYWIVKIDSSGTRIWDKRYGGADVDWLSVVKQTVDHGFLLAGFSNSDTTGNKSQNSFGGYDYWVVKTDSSGNQLWDKNYGGSQDDELFSMENTPDLGMVLAGWSYSPVSGNKSQPSNGLSDHWIVKADSSGLIQWNKDFGGSNTEDELGNIIQTSDGGYLIACTSYSPISGDKSETNLGIEQSWLIKIDAIGIKQWDKTIFTNGHDEGCFAIQTERGCYVIGNRSNAGIGGYKTQSNRDSTNTSYDFWVIKFCDSTDVTGVAQNLMTNQDVSIFPNPFTNYILISFQKNDLKQFSLVIRDISGRTLLVKQEIIPNNNQTTKLDLSNISKGIYFLEVNVDGNSIVKKILKQ